jgi:hypothetical protein
MWGGLKAGVSAAKKLMNTMPLDLGRLNVRPLVERDSLTCVEGILLSPDAPPAACPELVLDQVRQCAAQVLEARKNGAGVRFHGG